MRDLIIDMDDTKHPFHMPFFDFHDERYGAARWDPARTIRENLNIGTETISDRILEFYERTDPGSLEPLPGLVVSLSALAEVFELWVFTARDESASYFTEAWMAAHLPEGLIRADRVIHTSSDRFTTKRSKLDVARERGLDVAAIVEDSLPTAREFAGAGIRAFLVPYPWNELEDADSQRPIVRASSIESAWVEISRELLSTQF